MSNRTPAATLRREVIRELHHAGLTGAHPAPEPKGLTVSERLRRDHGDILGLPWALSLHASQTLDLSGAQNQVTAEAERGGYDLRAVIHKRSGHDVTGAYVVLPLSVFIQVLRRLHPEELLSAQIRPDDT
jgi:hypothetical protein